MANQIITLVIPKTLTPFFSRSLSAISFLRGLRPLAAAAVTSRHILLPSFRTLSTSPTTSSLNDQNPNCYNRPPKHTVVLNGCNFEHWLVVMWKPDGDPSRDEIIDGYIKTFVEVIGK
ncbi:cobalt ion-binding protein, putative [Medicago truncatula]|nr:cobalt ion-binding protein, putative [Medicago truncatula]